MHFDNAVAAYTNRLREICNGNKYTADRYLDIMRYCCRQHVAEVGGSYLSAFVTL
jgi:DNA-directed RNA polymerase subunit N (RpoN/RPB10)